MICDKNILNASKFARKEKSLLAAKSRHKYIFILIFI